MKGNRTPPVDSQRDYHQKRPSPLYPLTAPGYNFATSDSIGRDSQLIRYSPTTAAGLGKFQQFLLQQQQQQHQHHLHTNLSGSSRSSSSSPLTSIENLNMPSSRTPPAFNSGMKVEEDVLVMDEFLVSNHSSSPGGGRSRLSALGSPSSLALGYNSEISGSWEYYKNNLHLRSQFAQGKEDVQPSPTRYSSIMKGRLSEEQVSRTSVTPGLSSYGARGHFHHQGAMANTNNGTEKYTVQRVSASVGNKSFGNQGSKDLMTTLVEWSPEDDNISVSRKSLTDLKKQMKLLSLTTKSSNGEEEEKSDADGDDNEAAAAAAGRETVDAFINDILYGDPSRKNRLPAFTEFYSHHQ